MSDTTTQPVLFPNLFSKPVDVAFDQRAICGASYFADDGRGLKSSRIGTIGQRFRVV